MCKLMDEKGRAGQVIKEGVQTGVSLERHKCKTDQRVDSRAHCYSMCVVRDAGRWFASVVRG